MQPDREKLVQQIHAGPMQVVLAVTGGGSTAIGDLLAVPGASRTVLEASVPYSADALVDYLGFEPDQSCSEATARALAMVAFERARRLSPDDPYRLMGVGCTASLASDREKRGPHRVHVAVQTARGTQVVSWQFNKQQRSRADEEDLSAGLVLGAIANIDRSDESPAVEFVPEFGERLTTDRVEVPPGDDSWSDLLLGSAERVASHFSSQEPPTEKPLSQAIFPGAFNPLHEAHRQMVDLAGKHLSCPVALELSMTNVDKRPLDFLDIRRRLLGCRGLPVWLTRAATFAEKADLFPKATFIVGADTIARVADVNYYGNCQERDAAIAAIAASGCRFLVFGRLVEGKFCPLEGLDLPPALRQLCEGIAEQTFRVDVSSSEIRETGEIQEDGRNP